MKNNRTAEQIAVMQAFVDGKKIKCRDKGYKRWQATSRPNWDWSRCDYRIVQTQRTVYVVLFDEWHEALWFDSKKEAVDAMSEGDCPKGVFPVVVNF